MHEPNRHSSEDYTQASEERCKILSRCAARQLGNTHTLTIIAPVRANTATAAIAAARVTTESSEPVVPGPWRSREEQYSCAGVL